MLMAVALRIRRTLVQTLVVVTVMFALLLGVQRYTSTAGSQTLDGTYDRGYESGAVSTAVPADAITGQPNFTR